jgi:hypothetical protein
MWIYIYMLCPHCADLQLMPQVEWHINDGWQVREAKEVVAWSDPGMSGRVRPLIHRQSMKARIDS